MRFWFDTEFIEDGKTIELISIGVVSEDGRELYRESCECNLARASQWVKDNVIPHLAGYTSPAFVDRATIARDLAAFMGPAPEIWAYYADYDWVALCQLFGTMMDLPTGWPRYCRDVKQLCVDVGDPRLPKQPNSEHHALVDARWTRDSWLLLKREERRILRGGT